MKSEPEKSISDLNDEAALQAWEKQARERHQQEMIQEQVVYDEINGPYTI